MPRTTFRPPSPHRQTGAALVVGLLLLLVLTVLAISGVNSTSLNLIMAGNAQFTQDAFQAAESCIESSLVQNDFIPDPTLPPETRTIRDVCSAVSKTQLCGMPQPALPGSSLKSYSTFHFEIDSDGTSARNASASNIQAIAIIAPATDTFAATGSITFGPPTEFGGPPTVICPDGSGGGAKDKLE